MINIDDNIFDKTWNDCLNTDAIYFLTELSFEYRDYLDDSDTIITSFGKTFKCSFHYKESDNTTYCILRDPNEKKMIIINPINELLNQLNINIICVWILEHLRYIYSILKILYQYKCPKVITTSMDMNMYQSLTNMVEYLYAKLPNIYNIKESQVHIVCLKDTISNYYSNYVTPYQIMRSQREDISLMYS